MNEGQQGRSNKLLLLYYAFTAVFMLLDYVFDFNLRLTFLDDQPAWRLAWYTLCFACFGLIWWRPEWAAWIGLAESLATMSFIILNTALRVVIVNDDIARCATDIKAFGFWRIRARDAKGTQKHDGQ